MNERVTASAALFVACIALPAVAQPSQPDGSWQNQPKSPPGTGPAAPDPAAPAPATPASAAAPPQPAPPAPASETPAAPEPTVLEEDTAAEPVTTPGGAGSMSATASAPTNPTPSPAPAIVKDETPDDGAMGSHRDHWIGTLGARTTYVTNTGYDPFATDNALTQLSVGLGRTLASDDRWSLAGLLLWDWGRAEATARGAESALDVHRLTIAAEGRYHLIRRLYLFGRLAPGALHWKANLEDRVTDLELSDDRWVFAADLSAGAAFEFAGETRGESKRPRGWVSVDGGYGWSAASGMELAAEEGTEDEEPAGPARAEALAFGDLGLRGGFFRVALGITY